MLNNRNHCCRKCQTFNEPYHRRANSKTIKTLSFSMTQNISCLQNAYVRILRATGWIRPRIYVASSYIPAICSIYVVQWNLLLSSFVRLDGYVLVRGRRSLAHVNRKLKNSRQVLGYRNGKIILSKSTHGYFPSILITFLQF